MSGSRVCFIRCAYLVVDACTQTLDRVSAATKTNERVALVDFYAECVFGSYDPICD